MPEEEKTSSEMNTPKRKSVRMESSSTEEQEEMKEVEKTPVAKERAESPRKV